MRQEKKAAIVLAAGKGTRMQADRPKQYLLLKGKPILYYSLKAFEDSEADEIILVTGKGEEEYCRKEIVERYNLTKVKRVISGGKERYNSVWEGLKALDSEDMQESGYVFIHDGARPFLTVETISTLLKETKIYQACVAGMPVKDTIKIADKNQNVAETPKRELVWQTQTPQVFRYHLVFQAYQQFFKQSDFIKVTDDAMVVEQMTGHTIHLVEASYQNIKITTPEDIMIAEAFINT